MTKAAILVKDCPLRGSLSTTVLFHYCYSQFKSNYVHKSHDKFLYRNMSSETIEPKKEIGKLREQLNVTDR